MARFTHLLSQFAKNKDHERRTRLLDSSRKEVNINANGTSGYTVKDYQSYHIRKVHRNLHHHLSRAAFGLYQ